MWRRLRVIGLVLSCGIAAGIAFHSVTASPKTALSPRNAADDSCSILLRNRTQPSAYFAKQAPLSMDSDPGLYYGPVPDKRPSASPGQQFLVLPSDLGPAGGNSELIASKTGKHLTWHEVVFRTLELHAIQSLSDGQHRYSFLVEKRPGIVYLDAKGGICSLPHLIPVVTDSVVRALKAKYEGKRVWRYPGEYDEHRDKCMLDRAGSSGRLSDNIAASFIITRIERLYATSHLSLPTSFGNQGYESVCPLLVFLKAQPSGHCLGIYRLLSDAWDFERAYSLTSPLDPGRKWPAKAKTMILSGKISKGMTPDMIAWAIGWPSSTATKNDLLELDHWLYYAPPPYSMDLYFKKGRLARQEGPHSQP